MLKHKQSEEQTEEPRIHSFVVPFSQQKPGTEYKSDSHEATQRQVALSLPATSQSEYAEKLMATVQTEARKFRQSRALTRGVVAGFGVLMGLLMLMFVARGVMQGKWDWGMLTSMTSMTSIAGMAAVSSKTYKSAASELAEIEDLRAVGPLAECLDIEEKTVRQQTEAALIRILPRLKVSDAGLLNTEQRFCLNKTLNGQNEELIIAILRAYEQVGDETALPYVEGWAGETLNTPSSTLASRTSGVVIQGLLGSKIKAPASAQIIQAAQECLPYLRTRVELQRASQTLLRGASANDVAPDTLLRAVHANTDTLPEQLLRPTLHDERN